MYNAKIQMVKKEFKKVGKVWVMVKWNEEEVTEEFYNNCVESVKFFKSLGGREKVIRNYTCFGNIPVTIISISPLGDQKTSRHFEFSN